MNIFIAILQVVIILGVPVLLIKLRQTKLVGLIGTIGMAYLIGILVSLIIFGIKKAGADISLNSDVSEIGSHVAIGIAIPLLLFSTDFKSVKKLSKRVLTSFGLLIVSVLIICVSLGLIMKDVLESSPALAGMAIGLYTGGTPNLNAIGNILGVDSATIALANLSDMLIGGVFYIFLLVACKPILKKILKTPPLESYANVSEADNVDALETSALPKKPLAISILIAFGIAVVGAGVGLVVWIILGSEQGKMIDYLVPSLMIVATILGLICSGNKRLRTTKGNSLMGHYLILVFSIALSMAVDFDKLTSNVIFIFVLFASATIGTFIVHVIFCKIFKIDADCAIVTMTAGVYGPAFIPAITKQLKCENLTAVGLICGSLGYAIGTFLGAGVGLLLML